MPPRLCCCGAPGCLLGFDDFDREDSNDPGPKWRILEGEWQITSNRLSGSGKLATTICHPLAYPLGSYVMRVKLIGFDGSVSDWEVFIGDPENPAWRVAVSHNNGTSQATLTLYDDSDTLIHAETYNGVTGTQELQICFVPGMMVSAFLGARIPHIDECDGSEGERCYTITGGPNVGGFAFGEGVFDDWEYSVHFLENENCESCSCYCFKSRFDYSCLPRTLTLTFESVGAVSATFPDITLTQSQGSPASPWPDKLGQWNSGVFNCGSPVGAEFTFRFECGNPLELMSLIPLSNTYGAELGGQIVWSWLSGALPTNSARQAIPEDSTCEPLSIVFPEIQLQSAFPGPGCDFSEFPFGGYQPYCGSRKDECFASPPDIRFIPRIIL